MNHERMQRWIDELRSGNHKQTCGTLHRQSYPGQEKHCALGVLDLVFQADQGRSALDTGRPYRTVLTNFLDIDILEAWKIIVLNDDRHYSFNDIADYLEKKYIPMSANIGKPERQVEIIPDVFPVETPEPYETPAETPAPVEAPVEEPVPA